MLHFQNDTTGPVQFEVMDVSKPLLSVSRVVAKGYRVVFDDDEYGSYMLHKDSNTYYKLYEKNGVYVMPGWVVPFQGQPSA